MITDICKRTVEIIKNSAKEDEKIMNNLASNNDDLIEKIRRLENKVE